MCSTPRLERIQEIVPETLRARLAAELLASGRLSARQAARLCESPQPKWPEVASAVSASDTPTVRQRTASA